MNPVEFPEQNVVLGKDQPEYTPLPAFSHAGEVITCWELTPREIEELIKTRRFWMRTLTFEGLFQPIIPQVESPFTPATEPPIIVDATICECGHAYGEHRHYGFADTCGSAGPGACTCARFRPQQEKAGA